MNHQKIEALIISNKHKEVLEQFKAYTEHNAEHLRAEVINHQSTYDELERDNRIGTITRSEYASAKAKLTMALLSLLDEIKKSNSSATKQQTVMEIPQSHVDGLKNNVKDVLSHLQDYNQQLSFTTDSMKRKEIEYKIQKCKDNLAYYLREFAKSNQNLPNDEIIKTAQQIVRDAQSNINIDKIEVSGGTVQIADNIHHHGLDEAKIEAMLKKHLNK